ncbi:MAG: dihydroorotate dehydrogenase electron transfer subunit [Planctomycetota bacterium]|nr:dihydroorotate dehydrogenase electron transfer subunit [Planctomycetaceae bacterium]MDQ3331453.1 dihydroorotate dehydrogenase electron transfer subunit [Planctomycetota bacterium]
MGLISTPPGMRTDAIETTATVVEQVRMARDTYRLRLRCPDVAKRIVPGQFFMVRPSTGSDPLLGRPFALYDVFEENGALAGIDFGYLVVGKLTSEMSRWQPGDMVRIWGPLGNGFPTPPPGRLIMVGGGIGQTPFLAVSREASGARRYGRPARTISANAERLTLLYGVRSREYLAGLDDFRRDGLTIRLSTDDGSEGHHGYVTELLDEEIASDPPAAVYCCGPEPMMHAVSERCERACVPCWLSLESPMACGFGACFSCVVKVKTGDGWDYRRSCVEGPVFRADELVL